MVDKLKNIILPVIFIGVAIMLLFGNTLFPKANTIIYGSDLNDQFYFWKSYLVESLGNGAVPFWNPYSFSGTPFLAHPSTAAFYPFNLVFFLLPLSSAFSVFLYLHLVLAGAGMYWYMRRRVDALSAFIASLVFSLSGFFAVRIYAGHIDIISTAVWIPWVFGSVTGTIENFNKQRFLTAIIFTVLQILAGYQAAVIFTWELIGLFLILHIFFQYKKEQKIINSMKKTAIFIAIIITSYGLSAIQILPTMEFVGRSIRFQGLSYGAASWGSYNLDTFRLFFSPFAYGSPFWDNYSYHGPGPNYLELAYFSGRIPVILLGLYFISQLMHFFRGKKIEKMCFFSLGALLFFAFMALGNNFPLHKILFDWIPVYRLFRFPSQHLIIAVFLLALVSGIIASKIKMIWMKVAILILITVELFGYDKNFIRPANLPTVSSDRTLTDFLEKTDKNARVLPHYNVTAVLRSMFDFESASYYRIPTTSGYNPLILYNYYHFIDLVNKSSISSIPFLNVEIPLINPMSPLLDFLNIRYVLTGNRGNLEEYPSGKYKIVATGEKYKLYENMHSTPRFFLVDDVQIYKSAKEVEDQILLHDTDLSKIILFNKNDLHNFLPADSACPQNDLGQVKIINYTANKITLEVNTVCNSFLSSSEVSYPGWKARLDGQASDIYLSNTAFRSIYVPKGIHRIEFYYRPTIYYLGGLISLTTIILLVLYLNKTYIYSHSGDPPAGGDTRI